VTRWLRIAYARCYFGWQTRTWPWRVPWQVALIGRKRPPEHVFEAFRRLHGVDAGETDQ
jgi:hypothetical protein